MVSVDVKHHGYLLFTHLKTRVQIVHFCSQGIHDASRRRQDEEEEQEEQEEDYDGQAGQVMRGQ